GVQAESRLFARGTGDRATPPQFLPPRRRHLIEGYAAVASISGARHSQIGEIDRQRGGGAGSAVRGTETEHDDTVGVSEKVMRCHWRMLWVAWHDCDPPHGAASRQSSRTAGLRTSPARTPAPRLGSLRQANTCRAGLANFALARQLSGGRS